MHLARLNCAWDCADNTESKPRRQWRHRLTQRWIKEVYGLRLGRIDDCRVGHSQWLVKGGVMVVKHDADPWPWMIRPMPVDPPEIIFLVFSQEIVKADV